MTRLPPLPLPEPDKPIAEMTGTERAAYVRKVQRVIRDDEVYRGTRRRGGRGCRMGLADTSGLPWESARQPLSLVHGQAAEAVVRG